MKRKRADRPNWRRIREKRYAKMCMESEAFTGYASLFYIDAVYEPLWLRPAGEEICLADNGYSWLQHFPQGTQYTITSIFDAQGTCIRWYIDICKRHYIDEDGVLWYEDLYLDLDVSPEGEIILLDVDELDDALRQGAISTVEYELAWRQASILMTALEEDMLPLLWLCEAHRDVLLKLL